MRINFLAMLCLYDVLM